LRALRETQRDLAVRLRPLPPHRPDGEPGADVEILTWLDNHSRYALSVTAHHRVSALIVLAAFRNTAAQHGIPASTLTDNGMVYTTRFAGGRGALGYLSPIEFEHLHTAATGAA
jgi:hypothetical protein